MSNKIISRQDAIKQGLKRYFTGIPCKRGHICQKTIHNQCVECAYLLGAKIRLKRNSDPEWKRRYLEKRALYRAARREELSLKGRNYRKNHPEKMQVIDRNHKLKRKSVEGQHTPFEIKKLLESQKNKCAWCKCRVYLKPTGGQTKAHIDHIMPLCKGGTNWIKNIQILCAACNLKKSKKHPIDWALENGRLV